MRQVFYALLAILFAPSAIAQNGSALAEAREMLDYGEWDRAYPLYDRAVKDCGAPSRCAAIMIERNQMLIDYRWLELARDRVMESAALIDRVDLGAPLVRKIKLQEAEWLWLTGDLGAAETALREELLTRDPDSPQLALSILAAVRRERGAVEEARNICERLLFAQFPEKTGSRERARTLANCQESFTGERAIATAIAQLTALNQNIDDPLVAYDGSDDYDDDEGYDPVRGSVEFALARLLRRSGETARALEIQLALVDRREDILWDRNALTGESYLEIALLYVELGDMDEAGDYFTNHVLEPQLVGQPPDSLALAETLEILARYELDEGWLRGSRTYAKRAGHIYVARLGKRTSFSTEAFQEIGRAKPLFLTQVQIAYQLAVRTRCRENPLQDGDTIVCTRPSRPSDR